MIFNSKRSVIISFIVVIVWLILTVWEDGFLHLQVGVTSAALLFVFMCLPLNKNYKILVNTEEIILYNILKTNIVIKVDEVTKIVFEKNIMYTYNRSMLYVYTNEDIYDVNIGNINEKELIPYLKQMADMKNIEFIIKKP